MALGPDFYFAIGNVLASVAIMLVVIRFYRRMEADQATVWVKMAYYMIQMAVFVALASIGFVVMTTSGDEVIFHSISLVTGTMALASSVMAWKFIEIAGSGVEEVFH